MVDVVVPHVQFEQFLVAEQQLSDVHSTVSLDLVPIHVQVLQQLTLLQRLCQ